MVRPPCCDKQNVKRGLWTAEEDAKILAYVSKYGTGNWTAVPKKAGLQRCGKSCRLRWSNYLRPDLNHDNFTPEEDDLIIRLHAAIGSRWSIIAQQLPGRTDNDVKNYWNTRLKKKLNGMGIDPVTHKPFSQIFADFGTIGGLLKSGSRIGFLSRDFKNVFNPKPEEEGVLGLSCTHVMTTPELLPKVEPTQEYCFLNNNTNNDSNDHSSFDLLEQLQAIKLLTEASNRTRYKTNYNASPHFLNQCAFLSTPSSSSSSSSSLSPSSSTCSTTAEGKPPITFSWRDFLLDDDLLPTDHHPQEQETAVQFSSRNFMRSQDQSLTAVQGQITNCEISMQNHGVPSNGSDQVPSSSNSSFLEAILDRENNGFLDFPSLFEEPFYF